MDIKIVVAVHKEHWVPEGDMYLPLFVGKAVSDEHLDFPGDDTGDNISSQNNKYSELTGLYWAWKNLDADAIGLVHYRRYLAQPGLCASVPGQDRTDRILTRETAEEILGRVDAVLPRKRRYVIETIRSHYDHTHDGEHLRLVTEIIEQMCPEYLDTYQSMMQRRSAHMFNVFLMKRDPFHAYCEWLFPILEELDRRVDDTDMSEFDRRYIGRIGEILLDVWITYHQIAYEEVPVVQLGRVSWARKARMFLAAKFRHRKYDQSL